MLFKDLIISSFFEVTLKASLFFDTIPLLDILQI